MNLPVIRVVVPTVTGREDHFQRCVAGYVNNAEGNYKLELVVVRDLPTCGLAWQAGLNDIREDYVHLTCDDIEPHSGWHIPAIDAVDKGFLPAPQVTDPGGFPQSHPAVGVFAQDWTPVHMSALPFASRAQMEKIAPLLTCHYFTDDWFSWRGQRFGWPVRLRSGYRFTHHWAQHKRGAGMTEPQRMQLDQLLFHKAQQMALTGEWTAPWPANGGDWSLVQ